MAKPLSQPWESIRSYHSQVTMYRTKQLGKLVSCLLTRLPIFSHNRKPFSERTFSLSYYHTSCIMYSFLFHSYQTSPLPSVLSPYIGRYQWYLSVAATCLHRYLSICRSCQCHPPSALICSATKLYSIAIIQCYLRRAHSLSFGYWVQCGQLPTSVNRYFRSEIPSSFCFDLNICMAKTSPACMLEIASRYHLLGAKSCWIFDFLTY